MGLVSALQSRSFELEPKAYFARQDRIFAAAADAVLGLGRVFLDRWDPLVAIETKAARRIDGCLLLSGGSDEDKSIFLVIDAKRVTRWLFKTRYRVTIYWGLPDEFVKPVLRLCDPAIEIPETELGSASEPLVIRLSKQLPNKDVIGCNPGHFARMQVAGDGTMELRFYREADG